MAIGRGSMRTKKCEGKEKRKATLKHKSQKINNKQKAPGVTLKLKIQIGPC